jgi:hypothetical protein
MQCSRLFLVVTLLAACGSSSSKSHADGPGPEDAKVFMDAPPVTGLQGLGQKCGMGLPACPANAPDCIGLGLPGGMSSTTFCTPHCDDNATAKTNAQGQFPQMSSGYNPAPDPTKCSAAYTGTVGTPACGVMLSYTPMDNPPKANKTYTGISLGCAIVCGMGNTCPTGLTCNTTVMACFPS